MIEARRKPTENENLILFSEVDGICPICAKSLMYVKNKKNFSKFQAAHIYPLNPTKEEFELLKNEEKICEDVNNLKNYIALCLDCHHEFDNPRTVEEYQRLLFLKKELLLRTKTRDDYFNFPVEKEIKEILTLLSNEDISDILEPLEFNALTIDSKADNTLTNLTKRKIKIDITEYYPYIKKLLFDLDLESQTISDTIAAQVKTFYLKLKKEKISQEKIYHFLSEWLSKKTGNSSLNACNIVISFFVQNCEVFS